jgi:hypothetical protein
LGVNANCAPVRGDRKSSDERSFARRAAARDARR